MASKVGRKRGSTSPFITKIHQILETPEYKDLISWNDEGDVFAVLNVASFASDVLPQFFKHRNYSSFVRQLNMYGFRKLKTEVSENTFSHPIFKRTNKAQLHKIRKIKKEFSDEDEEEDSEDDEQLIQSRSSHMHGKSLRSATNSSAASDPVKLLVEMNAKFESFANCAEELKVQAGFQAEQIKLLNLEIQNTKGLNEQRYEMLHQAMIRGLTNTLNRQFVNPMVGMHGFSMPFVPFPSNNYDERGMLGMPRLPGPRGYNWEEQTQSSFNPNSYPSNASKPLYNEKELGMRDKLVKKDEKNTDVHRPEDPLSSGLKQESKHLPNIGQSKQAKMQGECANPAFFQKQNNTHDIKQENDAREIKVKPEEKDMHNLQYWGLEREAMINEFFSRGQANIESLLRNNRS